MITAGLDESVVCTVNLVRKKRSRLLKGVLVVCVILTVMSSVPVDAADLDVQAFIENACIQDDISFTVEASSDLWERMLDNLLLMGRLWEVYAFKPSYRVSIKGSGLHVVDPTGIEGELFLIESSSKRHVFYGDGRMKHWGLPFGIRGKALFILNYTNVHNRVQATMTVYGEGGNRVVDIMLKAISPLFFTLVNRRVQHNIRDLNTIVRDIGRNPGNVCAMLPADQVPAFKKLCNFKKNSTAEQTFKTHSPK